MPLDRVELSAWQRLGLWLSITLSSSKWRDPALGKVALLNSTVFILWIKLGDSRQRYVFDLIIAVIKSHRFSCHWSKYWLVAQAVALPVSVGQQVPGRGWRGRYFGWYCTFTATERRGWCLLAFRWESGGWGIFINKVKKPKSIVEKHHRTCKIFFGSVCSGGAGAWLNLLWQP